MVIFTFFFMLSYAIFHAIFTVVALVLKAIVKLLSFIVHGICVDTKSHHTDGAMALMMML